MRLQGLVEGVDAHAVGGREQRQLLVDDRLDRGDVVASAARRVDETLQFEVGAVEFVQLLLHRRDPFAQFAFELARRTADDLLVGRRLAPFGLRIEVVGLRFEKRAEDAAVAVVEIAEDHLQRIVTLCQFGVFAAQAVGRVFEPVFERRVEEDREPQIVEHRHPQPHESVDRGADDALLAAFAPAELFEILFPCHLTAFRNWFRACSP